MSRIFDKDGSDVSHAYENVIGAMNQWHAVERADFMSKGYVALLDTHDVHYGKHGHLGDKYMRLDVGGSGAWMMELATGDVYGIKGYGKVDRKKIAGNIFDPNFDGTVLFRDRFRHGRFDNRRTS